MQLPRAVDGVGKASDVAHLAGEPGDLTVLGIDDLAKFRVIEHLMQHPWTVEDAAYFATTLGFHSLRRTKALLDELCGAGLLMKREDDGKDAVYGLLPDPDLRRQLRQEDCFHSVAAEHGSLLRRLAARSVARARSLAKRRKKAS
ncbi:MAG: hypothetical protein M0Z94_09620 [Dehalococcoidales bacterium]|nr:hypothetical protein [Dehalococcoidales bacterium]